MQDEQRLRYVVAKGALGGDFLANSLKVRPRDCMAAGYLGTVQRREIPYGRSLEFSGDQLSEPNLAWLWSHYFQQRSTSDGLRNDFLRSWGYVFWDTVRLRSSSVVNEE